MATSRRPLSSGTSIIECAEAADLVQRLQQHLQHLLQIPGPVDLLRDDLQPQRLPQAELGLHRRQPRAPRRRLLQEALDPSTSSTSYTSAAISRKIFSMPVTEAMAWMRRDIASNSGPSVSEWV